MSSKSIYLKSNENLNYTYLKPKFEFTHVYDGLIPSSSDVISSTNKSFSKFRYNSQSNLNSVDNGFNGVKSSACYSMPGSPNTHSKYPHLMGQGDSSELIEDFNNYNTDNPIVTNSINNNNNNNNNNNHTHTGRFERLRDLLGTFKKENHSTTQQNDHYLYLDEKSLEHRIQCQASNIILPVSF
ncbi:unnamed protein product [Schistosoma turkestanicum]|nr:unnamed protein product [Schistosoma turkestanicum]